MAGADSKWIAEKTAEGSGWVIFSGGGRKAIGFIASIVLARVLYPSDFGLIAMANVVMGFLGVFNGFAMGTFLVYKGQECDDYADTAFWMHMGIGAVLTTVMFFAAPFAAVAYGNEAIAPILKALAFLFLFGSFNPVHRAMLRRDMRFGELSRMTILLDLVNSAITVTLALSGFGVWSFVVPVLVRPVVAMAIIWRLCPWRPSLHFHPEQVREMIGYGRYVVGGDIAEIGLRYADFILIGHLLGAKVLGIYSFAYFSAVTLANYVNELSGFVAFPVIANLRDNREALERWGSQFLRAVSLLVFPVLAGQFVVGRDYILSLYGDRWVEAITPFRILILLGLLSALARPAVPMLRAAGKPQIPFRVTLVTLPILAGSLYFAVHRGIETAAVTVAVILGSSRLVTLFLGLKALGLPVRRVLREGVPSALAALFFTVILLGIDPPLARSVETPAVRLLVEVPLGATLYFLFLGLFFRDTLAWGARRVVSMLPAPLRSRLPGWAR